jgi:hypothetical protein
MDIEGAELLAIQGAHSALSNGIIHAILLEITDLNAIGFGYRAIEIWDYLKVLGYNFHNFDHKGRVLGKIKRLPDFSINQNLLAVKNF